MTIRAAQTGKVENTSNSVEAGSIPTAQRILDFERVREEKQDVAKVPSYMERLFMWFQGYPTMEGGGKLLRHPKSKTARSIIQAERTFWVTFLPLGYPQSVPNNYLPYAKWQFVQVLFGTMAGVLSTQALLFAVGMGKGAVPMAAAVNWIFKDGMGQLGGVLYAAFMNNRFDSDPKRLRFQANTMLQLATLLEILTPLVPNMFLFMASVSNIMKNISWLASSATRAPMNQSFALRDNLGDITAKFTSQAIAASLLGTGLGVLVSPMIGSATPNVMASFVPLALLTVYGNYRSNELIRMNTLNLQRAERALDTYFNCVREGPHPRQQESKIKREMHGTSAKHAKWSRHEPDAFCKWLLDDGHNEQMQRIARNAMPTVSEVADQETFVWAYKSMFGRSNLRLEPGLLKYTEETYGRGVQPEILERILTNSNLNHPEPYAIDMVLPVPGRTKVSKPQVAVWFTEDATASDVLRGFFHASCLRNVMENDLLREQVMTSVQNSCGTERVEAAVGAVQAFDGTAPMVRMTHTFVKKNIDNFVASLCGSDWHIENLFISDRAARIRTSFHREWAKTQGHQQAA
eukprot:Clim_evm25s9 gene=Clim_evmTU25s9